MLLPDPLAPTIETYSLGNLQVDAFEDVVDGIAGAEVLVEVFRRWRRAFGPIRRLFMRGAEIASVTVLLQVIVCDSKRISTSA